MMQEHRAILSLFYDESVEHLTPGFVAYRMQMSPQEASSLLDELVLDSVLDLELDDNGNLLYVLPESERQRVLAQGAHRQNNSANGPSRGFVSGHGPTHGSPHNASGTDGSVWSYEDPVHAPPPESSYGQPAHDPYAMTPHHHGGTIQHYEKQGSPMLAGFLSLIIVGAGQFYNREFTKGLGMFFGAAFMWLIGLGWIIQIWSIIDAYKVANTPRAIT